MRRTNIIYDTKMRIATEETLAPHTSVASDSPPPINII